MCGILVEMFLSVYTQEIDELCDEWVPEPLIPPITDDMRHEPPVLERWSVKTSLCLNSLPFFPFYA